MVNLRLTEPLKETDKNLKNSKTKKEVQLQDKRYFLEFPKHDFIHIHTAQLMGEIKKMANC